MALYFLLIIKKQKIPTLDLNWEEDLSLQTKEQTHLQEPQSKTSVVDISYEPYSPFSSYEQADSGYESQEESGSVLPLNDDSEVTLLQHSIRFALEEFAGEIRRSLEYFSYQQGKVDRLLLCGGVSNIKNIEAYFSKTVDVPCEKLAPFRAISLQASATDIDLIEQHQQEFSIAIGNALYILY